MSIIAWLILGLVAGFIASKIVNKQGEGLWLNIAVATEASTGSKGSDPGEPYRFDARSSGNAPAASP